ncbi:C-mannosyltransferase dpy-19 [Caenorhabditis elegans]|uniref:C-mannosyltransferase dpy-19 n=1 Tax=Caenorhabditis elegans TaxID=6239 RepID=DPY19_CAEEL|nr:C-mannosyltransferase dpy-19 [Caenorhabditis elegans]P34413.2 RecName: Full=C-mannosyltransferase dpy-19; AltName: Full=Protein dumpy-19 [Caenorhabditis elegans]CCD62139.1 C-mannosyltransferase dpy-19 [Caenorhabditis elegans]|eukprot:NP_498909.1 C-mannosyltransferase dpy-19 [Caenorhabditis elegans]
MAKKPKNSPEKSKYSSDTSSSLYSQTWLASVVIIGLLVGYINYQHVYTLFENDKHFSHLADFEREMAYRTEMGLYYSYYKTIINAPSFLEGVQEITHDTVTEHGHEINTLNRFNLYPEVILAFLYRPFRAFAKSANWQIELCWQVNRGELRPVESCEGIGNPHYFYITGVFIVAGTVASSIFYLGVLVSDSIFGGFLSVLCFAFNHGEATRVQWTPPLRESFAFPFIIGHIAILTFVIKYKKSGHSMILLLTSMAVPALLFWQFTQFAFFTQICSIFLAFSLDLIPFSTAKTVIHSHIISFLIGFLLLFGNEMMITALYFPSILALGMIIYISPLLSNLKFRPAYVLFLAIIFASITLGLKIGLSKGLGIEDDAHIFDILRSKFTSFANFHTRLYTCSAEFDFIQYSTIEKLCGTLLIPLALISLVTFVFNFVKNTNLLWRNSEEIGENGEILYNVVQLCCSTVMAFLIMRLKLFMTPHLCIVAALFANSKLLGGDRISKTIRVSALVGVIAILFYRGIPNIRQQLNVKGEYSNPDQEMLFDWIQHNTKQDAVFAGTMPVMANVKLTTLRPIVNHPHYEHVGIRERTLKVYSMFSKKPIAEVHKIMKEMGVNYFVFQLMNCSNDERRPECVYRGMWDEEDPKNSGRTALCDLWILAANSKDNSRIAPFKIVYNANRNYIVLKI